MNQEMIEIGDCIEINRLPNDCHFCEEYSECQKLFSTTKLTVVSKTKDAIVSDYVTLYDYDTKKKCIQHRLCFNNNDIRLYAKMKNGKYIVNKDGAICGSTIGGIDKISKENDVILNISSHYFEYVKNGNYYTFVNKYYFTCNNLKFKQKISKYYNKNMCNDISMEKINDNNESDKNQIINKISLIKIMHHLI